MSDHNDIYSIVERLRVLEEGLDKNQKSVNQLSATFRPKTVAVLTAKTDPKNPLAGKLVGGSESAEDDREPVEEAVATEDVVEKVKNSFKDFIKTVEKQITDTDIKEKKREDTDLKSRKRKDRDLIAKVVPVYKGTAYNESAPVKTVTMEDGVMCEIHGNERDGFEIRRGVKSLPTKFQNIAQAEMAMEMYQARMKKANESQDYMEER